MELYVCVDIYPNEEILDVALILKRMRILLRLPHHLSTQAWMHVEPTESISCSLKSLKTIRRMLP